MSCTALGRGLFTAFLLVSVPSGSRGQVVDSRADFLNALGAFSLALDGIRGDEGRSIATSLDSMAQALTRWDALIESRERAMAADIGSADPKLAARMHLALGGLYLNRARTTDAIRELTAARTSDPTRPEVPLLLGLAHTQVTGDESAATTAFQQALALDANAWYALSLASFRVTSVTSPPAMASSSARPVAASRPAK